MENAKIITALKSAIQSEGATANKWKGAAEMLLTVYPTEKAFGEGKDDVLAAIVVAMGKSAVDAIARKIERTDKSDKAEKARVAKKDAKAKAYTYLARLKGYMFPKEAVSKGPQQKAGLAELCRKDLEAVLKRCKASEASTFDLLGFTKAVKVALAMLK